MELENKRRLKKAQEIARGIDPEAGGFFRRCMEQAAIAGMEYEAKQWSRGTPEPTGDSGS